MTTAELGFYAVGLMNGVLGFAGLIMPPIIKKLGTKGSLSLGALSTFIYVGCQMLALTQAEQDGVKSDKFGLVYGLIIFTAALNGFGQSMFWMSGAKYINDCASDDNKGTYNAFLLTFDLGSHITGNLLAALVIPVSSTMMLYIVFTCICFLMIFYFLFVPEPLPVPGKESNADSKAPTCGDMWNLTFNKDYRMLTFMPLCNLSAVSLAVY